MKNRKNRQQSELEQFSYEDQFVYTYANQPQEDAEIPLQEEYIPDAESLARRRKKQQNTILVTMLCLLAAMLIGVIVIKQTVFRLNNVYVVGVGEEYAAEVINNCGLVRGQDIFSVNAEDVMKNLESNNRIVFRDIKVHLPNSVYLYVEKRERVAVLQWAGMLYELDATGRVLNMQNTTVLPEDVPVVIGLGVTSIHVGQTVSVSSSKRLTFYCDLMHELDVQGFRSHVKVISLSSLDNAYLEIDNGMSVRLGNGENLRAKIGAVRGCMDLAQQMDGELTLNVSIPEKPTMSVGIYRPDSGE